MTEGLGGPVEAAAEQWRPVIGYEGRYEISNRGRVRSLLSSKKGKAGGEKVLQTDNWGYHNVQLWSDGVAKRHSVHRLVAAAFLTDTWFPDAQVRHLDGNPANNHIHNLAWGTGSQNQFDVVSHGRNANANKTHCRNGHEYNEANTHYYVRSDGTFVGRACRVCNRSSAARRAARLRSKGAEKP